MVYIALNLNENENENERHDFRYRSHLIYFSIGVEKYGEREREAPRTKEAVDDIALKY